MKPKTKKIKFHVIPDPLPEALSAEEAKAMAAHAIGGDKIARERLIVGSLRMVAEVVGALLYSEHDRLHGLGGEDLYSVGCVELCGAVDKLKHAECPTAYLWRCVEGAVKDEITKHEEEALPPLSDFVPDWNESPFPEMEATPPLNEHEVDFIIDEYGECPLHKKYLRLRKQGETIKDAAAMIGRPASSMGDWERRWAKETFGILGRVAPVLMGRFAVDRRKEAKIAGSEDGSQRERPQDQGGVPGCSVNEDRRAEVSRRPQTPAGSAAYRATGRISDSPLSRPCHATASEATV